MAISSPPLTAEGSRPWRARHGGRPFGVLWASTFFFYLGFQLLLPVMPIYAVAVGGGEAHVGLIIGVFAFSAMLWKPLAGELADRLGRRPLVVAGTAIFLLASAAYPLATNIGSLLALRLVHGVGMGLGPTAATVMVTDLAPAARRGAAMGLFGLAPSIGMAVGPYLGIELERRAGLGTVFGVSAALEVLALGLAWLLPETRAPAALSAAGRLDASPVASGEGALGVLARRFFSARAVYPSVLLFALYFSYGGIVSFLPLYARERALGNPGLFFTMVALATVAVRSQAGALSDRRGRAVVVAPSLALAAGALALLAVARGPAWLLAAAALYGIGAGAAQPVLMAMTADRVPAEERGRAMGTFYTAWELGISGGSVILGLCAGVFGYEAAWMTAAVVAAAGAGLAVAWPGRR